MEIKSVDSRIEENGATVPDPAGPFHARVALRWKNLPGFIDHLTARLLTIPGAPSRN